MPMIMQAKEALRVPDQATPQPLNLQLWYGDVFVADLLNVIAHQGTWLATYRLAIAPVQGSQQRRLCDYVAFCEEWHQRLSRGEDHDAAEFDRFADIIWSGMWRVPCPDGTELAMAGGPIFVQGEASWNHPESGPSRELAAGEVWSRLTRHCSNRSGS